MNTYRSHLVLSALIAMGALSSAACDDGGSDSDGAAGGPGASGGSGGGSSSTNVLVSDFEKASTMDGVYDGHSEDAGRGWIIDWFTYTDKKEGVSPEGMITPAEGARFVAVDDPTRAGNTKVGNIKGGNWKSWGAGMGFNFKNPIAPIPLTEFKGVSFWAKSNGAASYSLKVKIVDSRNTPPAEGGTCVAGMPVAGAGCSDVPLYKAALTNEWKRFDLAWDQFKPEGWGKTGYTGVQLDSVLSIQFQVGKDLPFDISVDEVALTK